MSDKIKPTLISRNIKNISHTYLPRGRGLKSLSENVIHHWKTVAGVRSYLKAVFPYTAQAKLRANTLYTMQPDLYPIICLFLFYGNRVFCTSLRYKSFMKTIK